MKTPILFLVFNRLDTTKRVFEAIRLARPSRLYIASDGPRESRLGEDLKVQEVRKFVVDHVDWDCEVKTFFQEENLGCKVAVSNAITWFFQNEPEGIILEDDCLPDPTFFTYCEELLNYYRDNKKVMHISGDQFVPEFDNGASYYFAKIQHCWGWASWADRWESFSYRLDGYDERKIISLSDREEVQNYWLDILHRMQQNEIDSWAYAWTLNILAKDGFCINPSKNLISNIGFGSSGTHTNDEDSLYANLPTFPVAQIKHPSKIEIDEKSVDYISKFHFGIDDPTFWDRFVEGENGDFKVQFVTAQKRADQLSEGIRKLRAEKMGETKVFLERVELLTKEKESLLSVLTDTQEQLAMIQSSREWKIALLLQRTFKKIVPKDGLLRKMVGFVWGITKVLWKKAKALKSLCAFAVDEAIFFLKPRKRRHINAQSKKIAYIGHSYHNKTKSTAFLIEYLKKSYEVEVVLDESWNGGAYPDLSFVDESYLGVIFFQNLPSKEILEKIKNENIIFFPMYDGVDHTLAFWNQHRNLKVMNFSRTLHQMLAGWGFDSIFVQYFPKPQEFIPGEKNEAFFWQRLTKMNIDVISKLFGETLVKTHIHKSIDPNQEFQVPNKEQEEKYRITYSNWFDTREEMWKVIKQKGIYIAPREYEGIGMSFLEAMAMGKAVVAVNNPTMNEYIKHGETGYLFNLNNPKPIDFSNIEQVQKNTHTFMQKGYEKWEKEKYGIIEFIEKP